MSGGIKRQLAVFFAKGLAFGGQPHGNALDSHVDFCGMVLEVFFGVVFRSEGVHQKDAYLIPKSAHIA